MSNEDTVDVNKTDTKLTHKRSTIKTQLTKFSNFLEKYDSSNASQLKIRLQKIEQLWVEFDTVQTEIELLNIKDKRQSIERSNFEDTYFELVGKANELLECKNEDSITQTKSVDHNISQLNSCLEGQAKQTIDSLETSSENYTIAWDLINERFNNKRLIIQNHVKALFDLPIVTKDSHKSFSQFVDTFNKHIRALKALGEPTDQWSTLLVHLIVAKLDKESVKEWESSLPIKKLPTMVEMETFLQQRCQILGALSTEVQNSSTQGHKGTTNKSFTQNKRHSFVTKVQNKKLECSLCHEIHWIYQCPKFLNLPTEQRIQNIKKLGLCYNCLRFSHPASVCLSGNCKKCGCKHNTLLHKGIDNSVTTNNVSQPSTSSLSALGYTEPEEILLSTAIIKVMDAKGNYRTCRVILDSASQSNFITEKLANTLELSRHEIDIPVVGISQAEVPVKNYIITEISSRTNYYRTKTKFLVIPQITSMLPTQPVKLSSIKIPEHLKLADPYFAVPAEVDMLLGVDIFYKVLGSQNILNKNGPIIQQTQFGWIVSGNITMKNQSHNRVTNTRCYLSVDKLADEVAKFWEIEQFPNSKILSSEEQACEHHFQLNTQRNECGRFVVKLPFKDNVQLLGQSYNMALKRFGFLEKKLLNNSNLRKQYEEFMEEYVALGHMTEDTCQNEGFYLPHHPVVKEESLTTKVRVVFDASAPSTTGVSLNDTLMIGPKTQDDLIQIIMRFRLHNIVLTADIEKMYRQVLVNDNDTQYQKIIWRSNSSKPLQVFKLNTVTYGTAAAPYLATRCLKQLAMDEQEQHPFGSKILLRDFYVDDLLTGVETIEEAKRIRDDLITVLQKGGFNLRKWASNNLEVIKDLNEKSTDKMLMLDTTQTLKVLGLLWNPQTDNIKYSVKLNNSEQIFTKRAILSQIAKLFDPLGILGPVITSAKLIMQKLWLLKSNWDDEVTPELKQSWLEFINNLKAVNLLNIPRKVCCKSTDLQLHGFCDASEQAYGACTYILSSNQSGFRKMELICAKSKVVPLKRISLPRLELCAALLLSRLITDVVQALDVNFEKIILWSDSTVTLCWIDTPAHVLNTFVGNRVAEIQRLTHEYSWKHISSTDSPADIISRGCLASTLLENDLWWHGPPWIDKDAANWPDTKWELDPVPELKKNALTALVSNTKSDFLQRYSSYAKLKRIMAYCLRFIDRIKKSSNDLHSNLSATELNRAELKILKLVQQEELSTELKLLKDGFLDKKSKISNLCPFLDEFEIIRVGGRLKNSNLPYEMKHQILLPKSHYITKLIIQHEHKQLLHAGVQATLYNIRLKFWPIDGPNIVRRELRRCITCFKNNPQFYQYKMGDLPSFRTDVVRPFTNTGIDFCGPFFIKEKKFRNTKKIKVYIAIFICLSSKAVHIEVVSNLSTQAFIAALKRFFARRGMAYHLYSDNATNFVGPDKELQQLFKKLIAPHDDLKLYFEENGITWHFIPPRAPNFGGIWEATVRSFKHHFKRVAGTTLLTFEELNSLAIEIESILNSRPLTPLSSDPHDLTPLTPSHFLIGGLLKHLPEVDLSNVNSNKLTNWQHIVQLKQHFWNRWYKEYLNQLQPRRKWIHAGPDVLKAGTMVLIKEDNLPLAKWPLGRIIEQFPGDDGQVRVVIVKTADGTFKRPTSKLCILPNQ